MALHYSLYDMSDDEGDQARGISDEEDEPQAIEEIVEGEVEPFGNGDNEDADEGNELFGDTNALATDADKKEAKEKKVRKASQVPKMNTERLKGPGGIIAIDGLFSDFKMQGRGHEAEDLEQILKRMMRWTHCMYPCFAFPDCIEQIERLGHRMDIKNFMLRNRNQTILPEITPIQLLDDDEANVDDPALVRSADADDPAPSRWDSMDEDSSPPPVLAADLLERMRLNREAARKRRMDKMRVQEPDDVPLPVDGTPVSAETCSAPKSPEEARPDEDSTELETFMEVDQPADLNRDAFLPGISHVDNESSRSPSPCGTFQVDHDT